MNKLLKLVLLTLTCSFAAEAKPIQPVHYAKNDPQELGHGYDFEGNGKRDLPCFSSVYAKQALPAAQTPLRLDKARLSQALKQQIAVLRLNPTKSWRSEQLSLNHRQLMALSEKVLHQSEPMTIQDLSQFAEPYLIQGEDGCGNTHFTAYYSPVLQVKARPDDVYKYPLYRKPVSWPQGKALTRAQIDQDKALAGLGLELAYSDSLLDNFFLQVQGSGLAEYLDTPERVTLQYGGQNGLTYSSVGRYLVDHGYIAAEDISLKAIRAFFDQHPDKLEPFLYTNQSYVFFDKKKQGPRGSLHTEVVPRISIAVDPTFIPLGAVLLAEIPQLDDQGNFKGHQLTLLVAQDTGGAIKGTGHVDMYMGAGKKAQDMASNMHHYGRLWLLIPRK